MQTILLQSCQRGYIMTLYYDCESQVASISVGNTRRISNRLKLQPAPSLRLSEAVAVRAQNVLPVYCLENEVLSSLSLCHPSSFIIYDRLELPST
jgi:hypothetical protein